ncbi:MAG TPA: response regulator [Candidatus Acidoferrum sp.]|nr:response regulator [Candidatus Acidoferrum sp.]
MNGDESEILLVEDDPADAELTTRSLRRKGLANKITHLRDGAEALDYLFCRGAFQDKTLDRPPCMILLDLKLPRLSGHEVLRVIKSDWRTSAIPVIVLTSSNHEKDLLQCYRLGVNSYVQKPVELKKFQETLGALALYWLVVNQKPPASIFPPAASGEKP